MTTLNLKSRIIKGQPATGCYSHQKNNTKFYVVAYLDQLHYGLDIEVIFNELAK